MGIMLNNGTIHESQPIITEWEYKVLRAKKSGNIRAYRDAKKHLDKLKKNLLN